ncbi:MAG: hypothetical protein WBA97_34975 [Actinophytocola sp.]|uniref:hypothetical protein n=1 Tax=Actinophytocola sp. TaxID=1872138 RepID=UPI003C71CDD9
MNTVPAMRPAHYQPRRRPRPLMTGFSVTALVLGCVALAFSPVPIVNNLGFFCGVLGIIFGLIATIRARRWMPVFGIATATLGIVITLVLQAKWARELDEIQRDLDQFQHHRLAADRNI